MQLFENIKSTLVAVSLIVFIICFVLVGIVIAVKMTGKNAQGFREAFASVGGVMLGVIVAGAATGLVAAGTALAGMLG